MAGVEGVYSDFLLHRLDDRSRGGGAGGYSETPPVPLPEEYPLPEEWKTPPLWGVADSAPYFHDGSSPTLESAVRRHHGGAESVTAAYLKLACRRSGRGHRLSEDAASPRRRRARLPGDDREAHSGREPVAPLRGFAIGHAFPPRSVQERVALPAPG